VTAAGGVFTSMNSEVERLKDELDRLRTDRNEWRRRALVAEDDALALTALKNKLRAKLREVTGTLLNLRNEAHGMLALERAGIVELVSETNVRCLEHRIEEADSVLATARSANRLVPSIRYEAPIAGAVTFCGASESVVHVPTARCATNSPHLITQCKEFVEEGSDLKGML
jgi:hypothetical protein